MKNYRIGYQKLLVARSDKRHREIHEEMQPISKNKEQGGRNGKEAKVK